MRLAFAAIAVISGIFPAMAGSLKDDQNAAKELPPITMWDAYASVDIGKRWWSAERGGSISDTSEKTFGGRGTTAYNFGGGLGMQTDIMYRREKLAPIIHEEV